MLSNYLIFQVALADFDQGSGLLCNAYTGVPRKFQLSHKLCALCQAKYFFPGTASVVGLLVILGYCQQYYSLDRKRKLSVLNNQYHTFAAFWYFGTATFIYRVKLEYKITEAKRKNHEKLSFHTITVFTKEPAFQNPVVLVKSYWC